MLTKNVVIFDWMWLNGDGIIDQINFGDKENNSPLAEVLYSKG